MTEDDYPHKEVFAAYHVEFFDRGFWQNESIHGCEAHAKHRAARFEAKSRWVNGNRTVELEDVPVRVVKVTTTVERTVIE